MRAGLAAAGALRCGSRPSRSPALPSALQCISGDTALMGVGALSRRGVLRSAYDGGCCAELRRRLIGGGHPSELLLLIGRALAPSRDGALHRCRVSRVGCCAALR